MAHVGKFYPFVFRRDLSINRDPMARLPLKMQCPRNRWTSSVTLAASPVRWISEEAVVDEMVGTVTYQFINFPWNAEDIELLAIYKLTFLANEVNHEIKFRWDTDISNVSSVFGPATTNSTLGGTGVISVNRVGGAFTAFSPVNVNFVPWSLM